MSASNPSDSQGVEGSEHLARHAALAQCQSCYKAPEPGKPPLVCGRCKYARYCDATCQRKDWKMHKKVCSLVQGAMLAPTMPSCPYTNQDFKEFVAVHRLAVVEACVHAMKSYRSPPLYDESEYSLVIVVNYEPTRRKNPARRFSLAETRIVRTEELDRQFGAQMSQNRAAYLKEARKTDPTLHQFMNLMQAGPYMAVLPSRADEKMIRGSASHPMPDYEDWLRRRFVAHSVDTGVF